MGMMTKEPDTAEMITQLERSYWDALVAKDGERAVALSADPVIVAGGQGVSSITSEQHREMVKAEGDWELRSYKMENVHTQMVSDDVAIIAYTVHEEMIVDGKPLTLHANDASTWVKRDGEWKCSLHTESVVGDPFGRDKKNAK